MSDSNGSGITGVLIILVTIGIFIGTGFLAWNWIEPDNFWRVILFIIVWGLMVKAGHFIAALIIGGLASLFEDR